jgi:hypothetical protein
MAAMLTYLSNFFSGEVDPTWPHAVLLSITVLASFAVAAGIVFESPKYSESIHRIATMLVIVGVAVEAVCTIVLFVFDEGISSAQQSKIISLEKQIAPREIDGPAFTEIVRNGPKAKIELLYVREDPDSYQLALQIFWYLSNAGWDCRPQAPISPVTSSSPYADRPIAMTVTGHATGITLVVHEYGDIKWESPLGILFKAFRVTPGQAGRGIDPTVRSETIRIVVAPKPIPPGTLPPNATDSRDAILDGRPIQ